MFSFKKLLMIEVEEYYLLIGHDGRSYVRFWQSIFSLQKKKRERDRDLINSNKYK